MFHLQVLIWNMATSTLYFVKCILVKLCMEQYIEGIQIVVRICFIDWSENIYFMSREALNKIFFFFFFFFHVTRWVAKPRMKYMFFHAARWNKIHIHDKKLNFLFIIFKLVKQVVFYVARYRGLRGSPEFNYRHLCFMLPFTTKVLFFIFLINETSFDSACCVKHDVILACRRYVYRRILFLHPQE